MWGNTIVTGNFGVQYVDTDQSSTALAASGTGDNVETVLNAGGDSYSEWLPSANVTFQFMNDSFVRFAYGRTLARPRMDDLRASLEWGYNSDNEDSTDINNSPWGGSGGNPALRPWIADAFDLSFEKYVLDGLSYVAAAAFHTDLDSWVITLPQPFDFTGYPCGDCNPVLNQGLVTTPQNGEGGEISGFELSGAINLGAFTDSWWGGFGAIASASFTDSSVETEPGNEISVPGLSEDVYSLTLYYETERWSARVNGRYRSEFLGEVSGFGNGREFRTVEEETVVDAQLSYFFGGKLTGLNLLFQGLNLTDEEFVTFSNGDTRQVIDYQRYGRTYLLGLAYIWD
ncbi:MAG: TonB-dependent receptor [Gammaproteobacteria bacterium]